MSNDRYRQLSILVDLLLDALFLQAAEEGLGHGIGPAVSLAAHTRLQVIRTAESPPRVAAVLRALIRMNHGAARTPSAYGHQHGVEHQLAVNRRTGRPADDLAREEIHDDGEIEPALPRPNIGDIRHPGCVRPRDGETPLQQVGDQDGGFADRPAPDAIAMERPQIVLAHEACDAMLAAGLSRLAQVEEDPGSAIDAV